ncbi:MAG: hypothetical protein R2710_11895 [Acidimicrobiales bacterium]
MHPIEQLRYVARASGADASLLVQESASALGFFANDSAGLLTAARRLLSRQPGIGPLWDLAARMATATDPRAAARDAILGHRDDPTPREVAGAIGDGARVVIVGWPDQTVSGLLRRGDVEVLAVDVDGQARSVVHRFDRADVLAESIDPERIAGAIGASDLVIIEAVAVGEAAAIVETGSFTAAAVARATATPIWLVSGRGRHLPEAYFQCIVERTTDPDLPEWLAPTEVIGLGMVDRVVTEHGVQLVAELPSSTTPLATELLRPVK